MNSDIKPDFEKMAERICSQWNYHTVDDVDSMKDGMEKIWTDHVEPLLSTVKRLQETIKLNEAIIEDLRTKRAKDHSILQEENTEYKGKLDFYRNETLKLRKFLEDNKIGNPNQKLFDALYDHLVRLQEEKKELMKHLFILTSIPPQSQSYYKDIDDAIAIYNKYKES